MQINLGGITVSYNVVTLCLFSVFLINHFTLRRRTIDYTVTGPLVGFYLAMALLLIIPRTVSFDVQFSSLRAEFMNVALIPIILWHTFESNEDILFLRKVFTVIAIVMCLYGLYCFATTSNPYVSYLANVLNERDFATSYYEQMRGGFVGRVQSTTSHPMAWSATLFMFVYLFSMLWDNKGINFLYFSLITLLIMNMAVSGTRSGMIVFFIGLVYLYRTLSFRKKILSVLVFLLLLLFDIDTSILGHFKSYVDSIIGIFERNNTITGSSLEMRLSQLQAVLKMVDSEHILMGHGLTWTQQLIEKFTSIDGVLAFESIFFVQLVDNGLSGVLIWSVLFIYFFFLNRKAANNISLDKDLDYLNVLVISYAAFITITGLCDTWIKFTLIYTIMLKYVSIKRRNDALTYMPKDLLPLAPMAQISRELP